jgi:hypothetical protein
VELDSGEKKAFDRVGVYMAETSLHPQLKELCKQLDTIADGIKTGFGNNTAMMSQSWGWNFPSITSVALSRAASGLADTIRERAPANLTREMLGIVKEPAVFVEWQRRSGFIALLQYDFCSSQRAGTTLGMAGN